MTSLDVVDVTCAYGTEKVLKEINFSTDSNSFMGIIGPNASGKSTLIRTITRVLEPEGGAVLIDGEDIDHFEREELAKELAVAPQETPESPFTVLKTVMLGRSPHLEPLEIEDEEDLSIVRGALEMTETWDLADRPFTELSGGEKQKVIIAKALAQEPSVLLLDEPTDHLDINNQLEILDLIGKLNKERRMGIVATFHDLNLAARYCDFLILLHEKRLFARGPPEEVLKKEKIEEVYGIEVSIRLNPETNSLSVVPISDYKKDQIRPSKLNIHLICGGGTGVSLMHSLVQAGYRVTTGVLPPTDDDFRCARHLGLSVIPEAPFNTITEKAHKDNLELIGKADLVILTDPPFGLGNLKNLEAAAQAIDKKTVLLVERTPIAERDFTGGEAQNLYSNLKEKGGIKFSCTEEVLSFVKGLSQENE